jgi:hypothetical protein
MGTYEIILYVDGKRTVITVNANTQGAAQQIAKAQFFGAKVSIFSTRKLR